MSLRQLLRLLLAVSLATMTSGAAERQDGRGEAKPDKFPFFVPVQVVKPSKDHNNLQVVPESINLLRSASQRRPISVISVVGPYHSGKSFLLNSLLQKPSTFSVGPKTSPQTLGIWMCRTDLSAPDGSEIWLMDSEGFFGPQVTETYDAKIFTVATLLGSHLVYNTVKVIDQQAVNLLEMLARRAQLFRVRSLAPSAGVEEGGESTADASSDIPAFLSAKSFPPLTWVVEDFVQDMAASQGGASQAMDESAIATEWLKSYLTEDSKRFDDSDDTYEESDRTYLARLFPSLTVHTLFLPATSKSQLKDLSQLSWPELTDEFRNEVTALRGELFTTVRSKELYDRSSEDDVLSSPEDGMMTAEGFASALNFIVKALQKGFFPELPSLWASWRAQVGEVSLKDSYDLFETTLSEGVSPHPTGEAVTAAEFDRASRDARDKAIEFYTNLVADFGLPTRNGDLEMKMRNSQKKAHALWLEQVQNYITRIRSDLVADIEQRLFNVSLPCEPDTLEQIGKEATSTEVIRYKEILKEYEQQPPQKRLLSSDWMVGQLPKFDEDPVQELVKSADALLVRFKYENDRAISNLIRVALESSINTCDAAVDEANTKLVGDAVLQDWAKGVMAETTDSFTKKCTREYPWIASQPEFRSNKALLIQEVKDRIDTCMSRHAVRLAEHLRQEVEILMGEYRAEKRKLEMTALPADEAVLRREHTAITQDVLDRFDNDEEAVADSAAYKDFRSQLDHNMGAEWDRLRKKNIELWKVHSDDATACALEMSQKYVKESCPQGWMCLFKLWPSAHAARVKANLDECFDTKSSVKMPISMRQAVFDSWYEKELGKEAAEVRQNLMVFLFTLTLPVVWISWLSTRSR
ncbi:hypothetical protein FOZ63_005524 [Perkinsus olseni]|uniref:GB1/RHD3-type G domain-containing protein n=2 Tax=Perkinsus olseni TaxID=32597 RepID=A0A7J6S5M0_PEROL|nr:hypothetical protein FOZ62_005852 [Perkinsus olseni]KAF4753837.1 hypothetical protein FOZ63_005524 [Perkinsus olseni]